MQHRRAAHRQNALGGLAPVLPDAADPPAPMPRPIDVIVTCNAVDRRHRFAFWPSGVFRYLSSLLDCVIEKVLEHSLDALSHLCTTFGRNRTTVPVSLHSHQSGDCDLVKKLSKGSFFSELFSLFCCIIGIIGE